MVSSVAYLCLQFLIADYIDAAQSRLATPASTCHRAHHMSLGLGICGIWVLVFIYIFPGFKQMIHSDRVIHLFSDLFTVEKLASQDMI
jgi:hypothetical protein